MKYLCEPCDYTTEVKSNLNRHNKTLLHLQKMKEYEQSIMEEHKCSYCNRKFPKLSSLTRHENNCGKKQMKKVRQ